MSVEIGRAVEAELPASVGTGAWTPVAVFGFVSRVVYISSGFFFVGPELCRSMDYLDANVGYVAEFFRATRTLKCMLTAVRQKR